jgi:signal peptidase I
MSPPGLPAPSGEPSALAPHPAPRRLGRELTAGSRFAVVLALLYTLFFNLSVVRGNSMSPSIFDGDRILVEPWSYMFGGAQRGDVVVMRYPLDPSVDYIKRVIGLPGDDVTLAGGHVWVNGELLSEPYIADSDPDCYVSAHVQDEHYFVLGDNRPRSSDSREFGQVPADYVRGRVDVRLWPPGRMGLIP